MKKIIVLITIICCTFLITSCGSKSVDVSKKKDATVKELLDAYIDGFINADTDKVASVMPSFMEKDAKKYFSKESLKKQVKELKTKYGDDFEITYKINETIKATDEQLEALNRSLKRQYEDAVEANECYAYDGEFITKGSISSETQSLADVIYCRFDDTWKLVIS